MSIIHLAKSKQEIMPLFNGAFVENKPIPFPNKNGSCAYTNIFYWAHLVAYETSEFPLHPHEGFEIMTFVFKGSIEHYDTATKVWTPLGAGGVQVIQAGSGVEHSERITKGSELFQIWFDPDFSKSLKVDAKYKDYQSKLFDKVEENDIIKTYYLKDKGPINFETKGLDIQKQEFRAGGYTQTLDAEYTYSYYLISGDMKIDDKEVTTDGFVVLNESNSVKFEVKNDCELFVVKSPSSIDYKRFIDNRF